MQEDALKAERRDTHGWKEMRIGGLFARIGPLLARREGDGWRYGLRTDEAHTNPVGLVHGGVISSLIDHAIALVAWEAADRRPAVTVQLDTRFIDAARAGDLLEARATLRHRAQSLLFLDAEVAAGGRAIAAASAVVKLTSKEMGRRDER